MKDLTKIDILNIIKEANKEALEEYFPSDADNLVKRGKVTLRDIKVMCLARRIF